jgi:hypothetical protein
VYYGTEQGLVGSSGGTESGDGGFREPLWPSGFVSDHPLFKHIKLLTGWVAAVLVPG